MNNFDEDCFIDFTKHNNQNNIIKKKEIYDYDKVTTETYRVMRELHLDPITHEKVPDNLDFKFEYMWDPITGDRLQKDPNGGFHFNVINLAKNFYYNRLRMLWVDGDIIDGIKYEGYYGDGLKAGEDLYVPSRGISKHMHLFRLPIIDCYLSKEFNYSIITMGPKLTENEINEIQQIIDNYNRMKSKTKKKIININLIRMNELYTTAISKESSEKDARNAVDELKKMKV
jgi:hypothetical protein